MWNLKNSELDKNAFLEIRSLSLKLSQFLQNHPDIKYRYLDITVCMFDKNIKFNLDY